DQHRRGVRHLVLLHQAQQLAAEVRGGIGVRRQLDVRRTVEAASAFHEGGQGGIVKGGARYRVELEFRVVPPLVVDLRQRRQLVATWPAPGPPEMDDGDATA